MRPLSSLFLNLMLAAVSLLWPWMVFVPLALWCLPLAVMVISGFYWRSGKPPAERLMLKYFIYFSRPQLSVALSRAAIQTAVCSSIFLLSAGLHESPMYATAGAALTVIPLCLARYLDPLSYLERDATRAFEWGGFADLRKVLSEALAVTALVREVAPRAFQAMNLAAREDEYRQLLAHPQSRLAARPVHGRTT